MQLLVMLFPAILLLALLALGAALAERWARERGRSQAGWIVLTLLGGLAGFGGSALLVRALLEAPGAGSGAVLAGVLGTPLAAAALQALVLVVLRRQRPLLPTLPDGSLPVYWLKKGREGEAARLRIERGALRLEGNEARRIPFAEIEALELEAEGLRIRWAGGNLVLLPEAGGDEAWEAGRRTSEALRLRILRAMQREHADGEHPYRG